MNYQWRLTGLFILIINLGLNAQNPGWVSPNGSSYLFNANVIATVALDDVLSNNNQDRIAIFSGSELSGLSSPIIVGNNVIHFITVYSNSFTASMQIKIFHAASNQVYDVLNGFDFVAQGLTGSFEAPLEVKAYLLGDAPIALSEVPAQFMLQDYPFAPIYLPDYLLQTDDDIVSWSADNNINLEFSWLNDSLFVHPVEGFFGQTALTVYAIEQTDNSYSAQTEIIFNVIQAYDGPKWITLPGEGIFSNETFAPIVLPDFETQFSGECQQFTIYPMLEPHTGPDVTPDWAVNDVFSTSMTVTAAVSYTPNYIFNHPDDILVAFMNGHVCGIARPQVINNKTYFFLSIGSNAIEGEVLISFYSAQLNTIFEFPGSLQFVAQEVLGDPDNPLVLDFSPLLPAIDMQGVLTVSVQDDSWTGQASFSLVAADCTYPTLLNDTTSLVFCITDENFFTGSIPDSTDVICYAGIPATIGIETPASGGDGNYSYVWRSSVDNFSSSIPNANSAIFTPPAGLVNNISYKRFVNDGSCTAFDYASSGEWTVVVRPQFSAGAIASVGETICYGGSAGEIGNVITSTGGDNEIMYSWRSSEDNYASLIPGATASEYTPPVGLTQTRSYRRYAQDGICNTIPEVSSGEWTVVVRPQFSAGAIASVGETICYGGSSGEIGNVITSTGGDNEIMYSWRSSEDNYASSIPGATDSEYTPPVGLTQTRSYRRYAQDGICNTIPEVSSGEWTVVVRPQPIIACPSDMMVATSDDGEGNCLVSVSWIHPLETAGACPPNALTLSQDGGFAETVIPGEVKSNNFEPGVYFFRYEATDAGGNATSCTFELTVVDDEAPVFNVLPFTTISFNGNLSRILELADFGELVDNCSTVITHIEPSAIHISQIGQTIPVMILGQDISGNIAIAMSEVEVLGLPEGWRHEEGSVGACTSNVDYNIMTATWMATAENCSSNSPFIYDNQLFAQRTLCANGSITARITEIAGGSAWAGVVMRESNNQDAKKVQLMVNTTSNTGRREIRMTAGGQSFPISFINVFSRNWVRLVREGNNFKGYTSANGIVWWQVFQVSIPMNNCIEVGLVLTNIDANVPATATYNNVSVSGSLFPGVLVFPQQELHQEFLAEPIVEVYPNPTSGNFRVTVTQEELGEISLRVFNAFGQAVVNNSYHASEILSEEISLSGLSPGLYWLELRYDEGQSSWKKIILK